MILKSRSEDESLIPLAEDADINHVVFKHDRIYKHNIMRVNYTTYDVRREDDIVHPSGFQRNIMTLADSDASDHPFQYGQVIGIYHVNVIYVGSGMVDYQPIHLPFLWVRWYEQATNHCGWRGLKLDRVKFRSWEDPGAYSFVDPSDVLRGCHIIPRFRVGKVHIDGKGMSRCARDGADWKEYYINR